MKPLQTNRWVGKSHLAFICREGNGGKTPWPSESSHVAEPIDNFRANRMTLSFPTEHPFLSCDQEIAPLRCKDGLLYFNSLALQKIGCISISCIHQSDE